MTKSAIAATLLRAIVPENAVEPINVEGMGDIGIKLLTAGERSKIYTDNKDLKDVPFFTVVMKETVVDPETGELALTDFTHQELARLRPDVVDEFIEKAFYLNGFAKRGKEQAQEDLKN